MLISPPPPQHPLPAINVPSHTEDQVYPLPTIVFRFFTNDDLCYADPGSVLPSGDSIDRYLLEDAIACILSSHEENKKEWYVADGEGGTDRRTEGRTDRRREGGKEGKKEGLHTSPGLVLPFHPAILTPSFPPSFLLPHPPKNWQTISQVL